MRLKAAGEHVCIITAKLRVAYSHITPSRVNEQLGDGGGACRCHVEYLPRLLQIIYAGRASTSQAFQQRTCHRAATAEEFGQATVLGLMLLLPAAALSLLPTNCILCDAQIEERRCLCSNAARHLLLVHLQTRGRGERRQQLHAPQSASNRGWADRFALATVCFFVAA